MSYDAPFKNNHVLIYYVAAVALYCFLMTCKKIYYRRKNNKSFFVIPRLDIRNISGVSMMTAMNIALIITISLLSNQIMGIFFKVYPGARFLIENILIKLGGILFGPIVGIFIGFTTDLLTVIFTSSVLNYGYFFCAMMNGFFGGLIHVINNFKGSNLKKTFTALFLGFLSLFFAGWVLKTNSLGKPYNARILSLNISMRWNTLFLLLFAVMALAMFLLIISTIATLNVNNEKYNYKKWVPFMAEKYTFFLIAMCNTSIYLFVDIIALPMFDVSLSSLPYEQFLVFRIIISIPSIILFSYLLHYIYKLHSSIKKDKTSHIQKDLKNDSEDKKKFLPRLMF